VGLLAIKADCPVLPVYIHNSDRLSSFDRVSVVFGKPISPSGETDPQVFSDKLMDAIQALQRAHFPETEAV
jgi:1-acyl-sn-glycerol-3-phosphate acyltransferase